MADLVIYRRRKRVQAHEREETDEGESFNSSAQTPKLGEDDDETEAQVLAESMLRNNDDRRPKLQVFLDLGQSDFSYSTCKTCGLFYARGHDEDEKLHSAFHMNCVRGIQFKGWQKERVIMEGDKNDERVILVVHSDPLPHHLKVKEVTRIMEKELELEPGWLLHSCCKVYLYISSKKVVGCIVVEPINQAYQLLSQKLKVRRPEDNQHKDEIPLCDVGATKTSSSRKTLVFGNITFKREVVQKRSKYEDVTPNADVFSNIAVPAVCGIRGIWVSRKERSQGIATRLLDAMRSSFVYGLAVDISQCAFLLPTSDGQAFAAKYCKTNKFLVYS